MRDAQVFKNCYFINKLVIFFSECVILFISVAVIGIYFYAGEVSSILISYKLR
jgi:hypothetical protein